MGLKSVRRGFSLLELLIAFGIISTALLLTIGVFTTVFRSSQKTVDLTAGTIVAEYVLDDYIYRLLNNTPNWAQPAWDLEKNRFFNPVAGSDYTSGTSQDMNGTVFSFVIYTQNIDNTVGNRTAKADIIVWWWRPGPIDVADASRGVQGYGFLRAEMSRLVNENSKY